MAISNLLKLFRKKNPRASQEQTLDAALSSTSNCQICNASADYLDTVDLNKSCEEARGFVLPPSGVQIDYFLCDVCGFCFAPEFYGWSFSDFEQLIYNDDYALIDPDYETVRPEGQAVLINQTFEAAKASLRHLDYGAGQGLLSKKLKGNGWDSTSYDPFVDVDIEVSELGSFDLVTAFEVFEHVPDVAALLADLRMLCKPDGLIFFTTLLSDQDIAKGRPLTWWYASPRNGHISLFSAKSLALSIQKTGFQLSSFSDGAHIAYRTLPAWATHLKRKVE